MEKSTKDVTKEKKKRQDLYQKKGGFFLKMHHFFQKALKFENNIS